MLHALIDRQEGEVAGPSQAAMAEEAGESPEHTWFTVRIHHYPVHEVRAWQVQQGSGNALADVTQEIGGLFAQQTMEIGHCFLRLIGRVGGVASCSQTAFRRT